MDLFEKLLSYEVDLTLLVPQTVEANLLCFIFICLYIPGYRLTAHFFDKSAEFHVERSVSGEASKKPKVYRSTQSTIVLMIFWWAFVWVMMVRKDV